ncbi:MAG: hypothetical protein NZO58_11940 [Gemmataceae bacterium]|nr:hypothetical protein [Gemmataceae bacterium]
MTDFDWNLGLVTTVALLAGAVGIWWTRAHHSPLRSRLGRCLFVVSLLTLGATVGLAAVEQALCLPPLGILSVFLTVGMLWDAPAAPWQQT